MSYAKYMEDHDLPKEGQTPPSYEDDSDAELTDIELGQLEWEAVDRDWRKYLDSHRSSQMGKGNS